MNNKKEKGSVTLFILISCMFMIIILLVVNIGVMNKNRSQEKELEEISKQYNQNETDLNNSYDEVVDENEYLTKAEVLELIKENDEYHVGDTCVLHASTAGYETRSGTTYVCTIYLDKKIAKDVKSYTVNSIGGVKVLQNGNYLLGDSSEFATSGFELEVPVLNPSEDDLNGNYLRVTLSLDKKNSESINNDTIAIIISKLNITFN